MKRRNPSRSPRKPIRKPSSAKYFLVGGSMLALIGLMSDFQGGLQSRKVSNVCQEVIQAQAVLSRDQLARLLAIPERDRKENVRAIMSEPYCQLPSVEVRQGVVAEREAYPLAFDPQTWFVVLYEGEEYAGYSFVFKH